MKIYIPQPIAEAGSQYLLERGYELQLGTASDAETMKREVGDADAILVRTAKITADVLAAAPNVKVVGRHGVGTDNIDLEYCKAHGIRVTNGPYSNTEAVAEHVVAYVTACAYMVRELDIAVRSGDWDMRNRIRLVELNEKTVGFIGFGKIGRSAAAKLHAAFNMKIVAWSRHLKQEDVPEYVHVASNMEEVLQVSDFVSLNCPATAESADLMNSETLAQMKPDAYLINCGRGQLVDENALYNALRDGKIRGYATDCMKAEPVEADNPLLTLPNVIFSPHCSSHTNESFDRMALHAAMGIDEVLSGKEVTWSVV